MEVSAVRFVLTAALTTLVFLVAGCSVSSLGVTEENSIRSEGATTTSPTTPNGAEPPVVASIVEPAATPSAGTEDGPELSTDPDRVYRAGTCFLPIEGQPDAVEVRCDAPHTIEIYGVRALPGGPEAPYPGLEAAVELCNQDFMAIMGIGLGLATVYERSVLRPSEQTWVTGERDVTCYVVYPSEVPLPMVEVDPLRNFGRISIYGLAKGDCFVDFNPSQSSFELLDCQEPHDAEVFVSSPLPPGPYPGTEAVDQIADDLCFGDRFEEFVGLAYADSAIFSLRSRPTEETWNLGDRTINCILTDELVRSGSLEGSGL